MTSARITDIANVIDSLHSTPKYTDKGYPMVRVVDVNNKFIKLDSCLKVDEDTFNKHNKNHKPCKGDIIIARVGSYGMLGYVDSDKEFCLGQNIAIIHPFKSSKFLYYYLQSPYLKNILYSKIGGSAYKCIGLDDIRKLPYNDLGLNTEKIGNFLYLLDEKIELNNKIHFDLEKIVKTIYDYWFVQFDFPDKNGKPYKSSGGKMIWNNELKKEIPDGWEIKHLKDLFEFEKGIEPGSSEYLNSSENDNCIKFFRVGDIEGESAIYIDSTNKKYTKVEEKDVVVTFDGSVGKIGLGLNGAISGGLRKIYDKSKKYNNSLVYFIFRDERIIATIHKYATGSILLHASSSIDHLKIPFEKSVYLKFQEITTPFFDQIVKNKRENFKLIELRDWLLPMLMNGQVKVN